jgi:hypothetical protein
MPWVWDDMATTMTATTATTTIYRYSDQYNQSNTISTVKITFLQDRYNPLDL